MVSLCTCFLQTVILYMPVKQQILCNVWRKWIFYSPANLSFKYIWVKVPTVKDIPENIQHILDKNYFYLKTKRRQKIKNMLTDPPFVLLHKRPCMYTETTRLRCLSFSTQRKHQHFKLRTNGKVFSLKYEICMFDKKTSEEKKYRSRLFWILKVQMLLPRFKEKIIPVFCFILT